MHAMADDGERGRGQGRLPVRLLVVVLVAQLLLAAIAIWFAINGWPFVGGGRDADPIPEAQGASAPGVDPRFLTAPSDGVPTPGSDRFDEAAAFALLRRQVERYGHRPAGSPALRRLAVDLRARLPAGRFEAVPGHPGLRNVVGVIPGRRPAIVIGAHYDVEAEPAGFVGANDGAAGTAAVVGIARALRAAPRPRGAREVRFVLFDGEEEPAGSTDFARDGLRGSRAYARRHAASIGSVIVVDYVANRGLRLPREGTSDRALWARLRAAARRVGTIAAFPAGAQGAILDDHTPFLEEGIPAIDLIDFAYPWRDTLEDDLTKVSPRSLDVTGETVLDLVRAERLR
jgi:hypothetical protein